jgi:hypothetical protein
VIAVNAYFDFDDYFDPVNTFLDTRLKYSLLANFKLTSTVYLKNNTAEYGDNIFNVTPFGTDLTFVNFDRVEEKLRY